MKITIGKVHNLQTRSSQGGAHACSAYQAYLTLAVTVLNSMRFT